MFDSWAISTSAKIQKPGLILNKDFEYADTLGHDKSFDDFNDLILDQEGKGKDMVIRSDVMKSTIFIDLANMMNEMGIFNKILKATQ